MDNSYHLTSANRKLQNPCIPWLKQQVKADLRTRWRFDSGILVIDRANLVSAKTCISKGNGSLDWWSQFSRYTERIWGPTLEIKPGFCVSNLSCPEQIHFWKVWLKCPSTSSVIHILELAFADANWISGIWYIWGAIEVGLCLYDIWGLLQTHPWTGIWHEIVLSGAQGRLHWSDLQGDYNVRLWVLWDLFWGEEWTMSRRNIQTFASKRVEVLEDAMTWWQDKCCPTPGSWICAFPLLPYKSFRSGRKCT